MVSKNREYIYLILMTFFRYLGDCFFYGYLYLYLSHNGLLESEIGLITCVTPIIAIVSNPIWNHFAKNANTNRLMMLFLTILEGTSIFMFTAIKPSEIVVIMAFMVLISVFGTPYYNLHDGFCETFGEIYHKKYAVIRAFGTIGYFVASLLAALILHLTGDNYKFLLYMAALLFISNSLWFVVIKPLDLTLINTDDKEEVKRNYADVLKNGSFWFYLLITLLIVSVSYSADRYASTFFTNYHGLSATSWSLVYSGMLLTEFVVILFTTRIKKVKPAHAFIIIGACYLVRSIAFSFDLPLPILISASMLRGVAYGFYLPFSIKALAEICGLKNVTCAVFVVAIFNAIIQALTLMLFGRWITNIGYHKFYFITFVIVLIGNVINLIYAIYHKFDYRSQKNL